MLKEESHFQGVKKWPARQRDIKISGPFSLVSLQRPHLDFNHHSSLFHQHFQHHHQNGGRPHSNTRLPRPTPNPNVRLGPLHRLPPPLRLHPRPSRSVHTSVRHPANTHKHPAISHAARRYTGIHSARSDAAANAEPRGTTSRDGV